MTRMMSSHQKPMQGTPSNGGSLGLPSLAAAVQLALNIQDSWYRQSSFPDESSLQDVKLGSGGAHASAWLNRCLNHVHHAMAAVV